MGNWHVGSTSDDGDANYREREKGTQTTHFRLARLFIRFIMVRYASEPYPPRQTERVKERERDTGKIPNTAAGCNDLV